MSRWRSKIKLILYRIIASGGGAGYLPKAPGTWGTLVGFIGAYVLSFKILALFCVLLFLIGWWSAHSVIQKIDQDLDPAWIVIDEIVGIMICGLFIKYYNGSNLLMWLFSFILFRGFDIIKIGPVKWADQKLCKHKSTAGLGIMLDDVFAALLTIIVLYGLKVLNSQL